MSDPKDLGDNDLQAIHEARLNPFAAVLIAESFGLGAHVRHKLESVTFTILIKNGRKVRVTLKDETTRREGGRR